MNGSWEVVPPSEKPTREDWLFRPYAWLFKRIGDHPITALTIIGLLLYSLVRVDYVLFYGRLGVTPDDVGLAYSEILAQSSVVALLLAVVALFLAALAAILGIWLAIVLITSRFAASVVLFVLGTLGELASAIRRWDFSRLGSSASWELGYQRGKVKEFVDRVAGWIFGLISTWKKARVTLSITLSVFLVFMLLLLPAVAVNRAGRAKGGKEVRPVNVFGFQILAIRASPERLFWVNGGRPVDLPVQNGGCLLSLGSANGTAVFYDWKADQPIKLPKDSVALYGTSRCREPPGQFQPNPADGKHQTVGATGPTGPPGPRGVPGPTGASGIKGSPGEAGARGKTGSPGRAGPTGRKGSRGEMGPRGRRGQPGPTGPRGRTGPPGPRGARGPRADPGMRG